MKFNKDELLTLGKGYDITQNSLIVLDSNFTIKYANCYAKCLLNWANDNEWVDKPFNAMWQSLGLPTLIDHSSLVLSEPITIKEYARYWKLIPVSVDSQKHYFLLDKDTTGEARIYEILERSLKGITGQDFPYKLSAHEYIDEIRNYLENLIIQMPGYVYYKDKNFKYLLCNELTSNHILRLSSPREIAGKTDYDFGWDPKLVDKYRRIDEEIIRTGKPKLGIHEELITPEGKKFQLSVNKMPLVNNSGDTIGIVGISIDITAEKEAERLKLECERQKLENERLEFENREHQIREEEQEKFKKIVGQMVHDIQSPLVALRELFKASSAEIPEDRRLILGSAVNSIADITNYVLNKFTNHEVKEEERQPLLVSEALLDVLSQKRQEYKKLPIEFKHKFNSDANFSFIKIEPSRFRRMISNLINNAVDAIKGNSAGVIELKLSNIGDKVTILIKDDGKGMSKEVVAKILEGVEITEGKQDGHGIGLTQVREALEGNNGIFNIISAPNYGTTINLKFPLIPLPGWIADTIKIKYNDNIVILDDDDSIHQAWDARFKNILEKYPELKIKHFKIGTEIVSYINSLTQEGKEKTYLLSDYELLKQEINGLDVIRQVNLKRSLLVTSYYADSEIYTQAIEQKVKILPKALAFAVEIKVDKGIAPGSKKVDMVWVDDEKAKLENLIAEHYKHLTIDTYNDPVSFLEDIEHYPPDTQIILDNYFYSNNVVCDLDGVELAKILHEKGYTKLYLISAIEPHLKQGYVTVILKSDTEKLYNLDKL